MTEHQHYGVDVWYAVTDAVCLAPIIHGTETPGQFPMEGPDHLAGFLYHHDRDGFEYRCGGYVRVCSCAEARPRWDMTGALEDGTLTLSPSILCTIGRAGLPECGFHGFVREGKWVPA